MCEQLGFSGGDTVCMVLLGWRRCSTWWVDRCFVTGIKEFENKFLKAVLV